MTVLNTLLLICGCSALYCFVVGELTHNNSQMDKLWSLLPIVYVWVIAAGGGFTTRLVVMAVLVTLWGARLTFNFARKGAYRLKFWEGEEDYRWPILRQNKMLQNKWAWMAFDLFFISIYQNALVLLICLPAYAVMSADAPFGWVDALAAVLLLGFLILETVADEQQWKFQSTKWGMLKSGKKLEELPSPYNKGFNTTGLWSRSRHPNYLGEQGIWCAFYLFSIPVGLLNWTVSGAVLLILLFLGSCSFAESISASKYPEYPAYKKQVNKYFPGKKYQA